MENKAGFTWEAPTVKEISAEHYNQKILPVLQTIARFKEATDVSRLSKNLRNLLLHYQTLAVDGQPFVMDDLLTDILGLFELLDSVE